MMCFLDRRVDGDHGCTHHGVLYIAFIGDDAVVGKDANWKTGTAKKSEKSLEGVGDKLVAKL
jgi:chitosanase